MLVSSRTASAPSRKVAFRCRNQADRIQRVDPLGQSTAGSKTIDKARHLGGRLRRRAANLWARTAAGGRGSRHDAATHEVRLASDLSIVEQSPKQGDMLKWVRLDQDAVVLARGSKPKLTRLDAHTTVIRSGAPEPKNRGGWLVEGRQVTPIAGPKALIDTVAAREMRRLLRMHKVNCVIDAGANIGQFAGRVRESGFTGRIISFEPVPQLFSVLAESAANDSEWRTVQAALGREDTTATINVTPGAGRLSSLLPSSEYGRRRQERLADAYPVTVDVRRLESLLPELLDGIDEPRIYLKMDTQGYDLEVFGGVGSGLDLVVAVQSEVSSIALYEGMPHLTEALDAYREAGFDLCGLWPITFEPGTHRALEFDALMVRGPQEDQARPSRSPSHAIP